MYLNQTVSVFVRRLYELGINLLLLIVVTFNHTAMIVRSSHLLYWHNQYFSDEFLMHHMCLCCKIAIKI